GRLHAHVERRHVALGVLDDVLEDGTEQAFLAAEIILNRRQVHVGTLGELARARALVSFGRENLESRFQDAPASVLTACLGPRTMTSDDVNHEPTICEAGACISVDRLCQSTDTIETHVTGSDSITIPLPPSPRAPAPACRAASARRPWPADRPEARPCR